MRLTCPNCGAQYEIPDDVLPESGRDVQCSNCGDTWFQHHPDHPPQDDAPADYGDDAVADVTYEGLPDETDGEGGPEPAEEGREVGADDPDAASAREQRRRLDPEVSAVLREEAEREARARAKEAGGIESQPDLGLEGGDDATDRRSREARSRMARLRGQTETTEPPEPPEIDPASRRGLLPDIEEINSSLRNGTEEGSAPDMDERYPDGATQTAAGGGGFRRGFLLVVLLAVILLLLYVLAPQIAATVPALADVLNEYVATVNDARLWLDAKILALMQWLDGMSSTGPAAAEGDA